MPSTPLYASLEKFRVQLGRTWRFHPNLDWWDHTFCAKKAYVCAVFAKIAYIKVEPAELKDASAIKIFPCLTRENLLKRGYIPDLVRFMQRADFPEPFFFAAEGVVAVGVKLRNVIIVSIRGTRPWNLREILMDLHATRSEVELSSSPNVKLHTGFYREISRSFAALSNRILAEKRGADIPVYVVGHSLGGAMAAIFHALGGQRPREIDSPVGEKTPIIQTDACYTVGMPRYANEAASNLPRPYHVMNTQDVVPTVPFQSMGFADSTDREWHMQDDSGNLFPGRRSAPFAFDPSDRFLKGTGIWHHFIECYIGRLAKVVGADD